MFGVHIMVRRVFNINRPKCPDAHVEGHRGTRDSAGGEPIEKIVCEVESGGRGGHGATLLRIHGLVSLAVHRLGLSPDVGRKRDAAIGGQRRVQCERSLQPYDTAPRVGRVDDLDAKVVSHLDGPSRLQLPAGSYERFPQHGVRA